MEFSVSLIILMAVSSVFASESSGFLPFERGSSTVPQLNINGAVYDFTPKNDHYLIKIDIDENSDENSDIVQARNTNGPENLNCFLIRQSTMPDISELITVNKPLETTFTPATSLICYALREPEAFVPVYLEDNEGRRSLEAIKFGEQFVDKQLPSWLQIIRKAVIMDEPVPNVECRLHVNRLGFPKVQQSVSFVFCVCCCGYIRLS